MIYKLIRNANYLFTFELLAIYTCALDAGPAHACVDMKDANDECQVSYFLERYQ